MLKCPHCQTAYNEDNALIGRVHLGHTPHEGECSVIAELCPECLQLVLFLTTLGPLSQRLVYPRAASRNQPPSEVEEKYAEDYREACLVLADSPKASAALSRRLLQLLLREKAGVKPGDLYAEIQQLLDSGALPSYLADSIDAVRAIGNFAAHPMKSQHTGEVLPVEPGEAEWLLDTIELLYDFYFVQPAKLQQRRTALNAKQGEAGKGPIR